MCEMVNLFVPCKHPIVPSVQGFTFAPGEVQKDLAARFGQKGTILAGFSRDRCLCGFSDWKVMVEVIRRVLESNPVEFVALLHFWSGDRYEVVERSIELFHDDEDEAFTPVTGELMILRAASHPERRVHRKVMKELAAAVGCNVRIVLKGGKALHGVLNQFDPTSEVGAIGSAVFVAAQVRAVERTEAPTGS